jgi:hypothetical protein
MEKNDSLFLKNRNISLFRNEGGGGRRDELISGWNGSCRLCGIEGCQNLSKDLFVNILKATCLP